METYPNLVPGVSRHAPNHIVDIEDNGLVSVRYQNLLVRYASPEAAATIVAEKVIETDELPALWLYSPMLDRLSVTDDGWKITDAISAGRRPMPGTHRRIFPARRWNAFCRKSDPHRVIAWSQNNRRNSHAI